MVRRVIFDKKNVLVTGGAGFLGSHLCDELIKSAKVICLDDFSSGDEKNIDHLLAEPDFEFVRHDLTVPIDLESLPELKKFKIAFQGVQEIYHLACPMSPKDFEDNKIAVILANSYGVKNALDLAAKYEAKFLHVSSSVVYGKAEGTGGKVRETDQGPLDPLSVTACYDEGKRFAETMVENYRSKFKLDAKIMRLFRTYGPRMKLDDGQMIPDFISNAIDNIDLTIYGGEDFASSFCYVGDAVDAALKMMEADINGPVNIGSDVRVPIREIAEMVIKSVKSTAKINYRDQLPFMRPLLVPDINKARNELGWMPVIPLDKGLEKTIYELRAGKGLKTVEHSEYQSEHKGEASNDVLIYD